MSPSEGQEKPVQEWPITHPYHPRNHQWTQFAAAALQGFLATGHDEAFNRISEMACT